MHRSPQIASGFVTAVTVGIVGVMGLAGADPYQVIAASIVSMGTLSIILVQAATAVAVMVFFRNRRDRGLFSGVIAPVVGALGLGTAFVLASVHYAALTGSRDVAINAVPLFIVVTAAAGTFAAVRLRRRRPLAYAQLAVSADRHRPDTRTPQQRPSYTRRYCVVGAGPSGMIIARALLREGVPFDWYERNPDFGGIWDMDHEGSPMYESCHFISSKYTSGFYGAPMPRQFPDYPRWREIRDYIRAVARQYGLYKHVRFNTEVTTAEPLAGDRWRVTLADGAVREYDGLICCPGVTWHPNQVSLPAQDVFGGVIRHSVTFRDGLELRGKRVLIVGAGNSGVDIACDAARHAACAYLSVRRGYRFVPKHIAGLPTDALLTGKLEPPKATLSSASNGTRHSPRKPRPPSGARPCRSHATCPTATPSRCSRIASSASGRASLPWSSSRRGSSSRGTSSIPPPQQLRVQLDTMLGSVVELASSAARAFTSRGSGHIIATVSSGGIIALPGSAAYSAAKAGLRAYLMALSAELRGTGIAVSGIYPSAVDTPMLLHEATHNGSLLNFLGKVSTVDDVAGVFERAQRKRRLEHYLPYSDSLLVRFLEFFPWIVPPLLGPANAIGRRGRRRYLERKGIDASV